MKNFRKHFQGLLRLMIDVFDETIRYWIFEFKRIRESTKDDHHSGRLWGQVFRDSDGILLFDYLQKGNTINGEYYATLLRKLRGLPLPRRGEKNSVKESCSCRTMHRSILLALQRLLQVTIASKFSHTHLTRQI